MQLMHKDKKAVPKVIAFFHARPDRNWQAICIYIGNCLKKTVHCAANAPLAYS
jgi:hypothetical protein